jgi:signal transduction histidine kinase
LFRLSLLNRAHQQAAVAALGQEALVGTELRTVLDHATTFVAQTLAVEFSAVYELHEEQRLRMVASAGWPSDWNGQTTLTCSPGSMAEYVLQAAEPVIVKNLRGIKHFEVPAYLQERNVVSGISVVIRGARGPWGILDAHCLRPRHFGEDDFHFMQAIANVIVSAHARRQSELENTKLAAFAQHNPNPVVELTREGEVRYSNPATHTMSAAFNRENPRSLLPGTLQQIVGECHASGQIMLDVPVEIDGRTLLWSFYPIPATERIHAYAVDATQRLNLEAQLRQSQKMEAIGQLAAGVAHDFNNILTIMQGLVRRLHTPAASPDSRDTLQQLHDTTERAAALTKQLLAFSRRQVLQPRVLDLRDTVNAVSRMLQRLIGEDIVLTVENAESLPAVEADPSMVEQVLLNLAVNARDAMPQGGQLVLTTGATEIAQPDGTQRKYVCVHMRDTGCGMPPEVKDRIFEPFFTTKEVGKGTGLGLATVFGIVKQHDGLIEVESEPGRGTTFSILFPATTSTAETPARPVTLELDTAMLTARGETILLVEDEPLLRELAQLVLTEAGYRVLEAGDGIEALAIWKQHADEVNLLVTDMVLPGGISGRQIALQLQRTKPGLHVVYTTGYSPDIIENGDQPVHFLQKPYPPEALTRIVRTCLDGAASSV